MQKVVITGGTGMIGTALSRALVEKGYSVIILTRKLPEHSSPGISYALWNVTKGEIDAKAIEEADAIIHLAGAGVMDKPWTEAYKKEIMDSRVKSSGLIIEALKKYPNNVKTVISSSAIGFYGADVPGSPAFTETAAPDPHFLGVVCKNWEDSIAPVTLLGKRLVTFRTGIVLGKSGGALAEFKKPVQFGIAAILSNGKQMISWIHLDDLCRMFLYALEHPISGTFNAVAPKPVSNKQLTLQLARSMKGSFFIPFHVPAFILKIMKGGRSIEILKSATVSAKKIMAEGFEFKFKEIDAALEDLK